MLSTISRMNSGTTQLRAAVALGPGLLGCDRHGVLERGGIMRADFGSDAVLQGGDDLASRRVVFRIGGEDKRHVERKTDRVALNLNVALLHDVEQANLNLARQIGQFVDGEDSAVGPGQQAVMNGQFA